ncbi:MAG: hypothetical protein A2Y23_02130 [Clostridiales bacterium GWB2_37_7]|nr:MAG: hypothetical protein A2Y23_02130 [Clostridiales bacterium GWB2_37_7]
MTVNINILDGEHVSDIVEATNGTNVRRREEYLRMCIRENEEKKRVTFVAFVGNDFAGMVNIIFESDYPYFRSNNIPEINDLLVVPRYRKQGVAKKLIDEVERFASSTYERIGLGVELYKDYGAAQRLYFKNGYIPDGNGLIYNNSEVVPGSNVRVDNDLLIYLYKQL